jgi:hypothetical protein
MKRMEFMDFAAIQGAMNFQRRPVGKGSENLGSVRRQST